MDVGAGHTVLDPALTHTVGSLGALCPYAILRKGDHGAAALKCVTELP